MRITISFEVESDHPTVALNVARKYCAIENSTGPTILNNIKIDGWRVEETPIKSIPESESLKWPHYSYEAAKIQWLAAHGLISSGSDAPIEALSDLPVELPAATQWEKDEFAD